MAARDDATHGAKNLSAKCDELHNDLCALRVRLERIDSQVVEITEGVYAMRDELIAQMTGMEERLSARLMNIEHEVRRSSEVLRADSEVLRSLRFDVRSLRDRDRLPRRS